MRIFDWDEARSPTDSCVAYRLTTRRKVAAAIYFNMGNGWSGNPPYSARINLPSHDDIPWYSSKFYSLGEAKAYVDSRLRMMGHETLSSHLKVLL